MCECANIRIWKCVMCNVRVSREWERANVRLRECKKLEILEKLTLQICKFGNNQLCECANVLICDFAGVRVYEYANVRTCEYANVRLWDIRSYECDNERF